jgi:hypothetical protein
MGGLSGGFVVADSTDDDAVDAPGLLSPLGSCPKPCPQLGKSVPAGHEQSRTNSLQIDVI